MTLKYLMDENVDPAYVIQIRRKRPNLVIWTVGEIGTPPKSTLDPEILLWCIDELILIAEYSFDKEYQDQIVHLPLAQNNF